ncbi:MAG: phospho-sugar mutase [Clostridia bacterium]|nr:phospho-sugar mutase [Clostridia bacterium]MBQ2091568.1 phospho-sugar mutase [Clostridia bacterium]MBQ3897633.1 phospho-sugar mutase [Clostridia bacterium]
MENYKELYELWAAECSDPALKAELDSIVGKDDEILDRFYKKLEFGTAGLRGVLGAGTNRMNIYTVGQATQGIADYLNATFENPSVAIAYDSRINSDLFSKETAGIFAANGIKTYIYRELVPTPMLSYAVRELHCSSGVIITASHNPAKYNGYKCYDPEGYQMTDAAAAEAYQYIQKVDMFKDIKKIGFEEGLANGTIEYISDEVYEKFFDLVASKVINPETAKTSGLKVIYTPLNGTGNKPVRKILARLGVQDVKVVPEQELPDGNFPTCPYPNPEIRQVFECGIKMAETDKADLLLATDPDCDRMGIAVRDGDDYRLMTGNEVGALFTEYVLSQYEAKGIMPKNPVVIKSFVTTNLVTKIAESHGAKVADLLTGFKYIGEYITNLEKEGHADDFTVGMEESYGYLLGIHARDKDAVVASQLLVEMAAYYKSVGKSLIDVMNDIYAKFGLYLNKVDSFEFEGAAGMQKMADIMESLRNNAPTEIAGLKVLEVTDYKDTAKTGLPSSNVLSYKLENGNGVVARPSGTEPKLKFYFTAVAANTDEAEALYGRMLENAKAWMEA